MLSAFTDEDAKLREEWTDWLMATQLQQDRTEAGVCKPESRV